ncbi:hypothetical protein SDRG_13864 [Saprolegnia diclina VS20]|uniref:RBR-type E3 ubiquitin transferase n=1 Tax=Saprolegnia diclina (strain VS20) TaxID=1156394 RepID=T0Q186_SAPDV|nr:hypothetical protein SDRG_13864 [Saprolegnia diclina VS20]EQC28316.1 hypothetical protein SDRG_13864 [Saprolegnia diclina VS20]|eukprot:XP_008618186.1 hypothetical protein SDRG_13864 [Saprolegnia diclina VS20]
MDSAVAATLAVLELIPSNYVPVLVLTTLVISLCVRSRDAANALVAYLVKVYCANLVFGWTGVAVLLVLAAAGILVPAAISILANANKMYKRSRSRVYRYTHASSSSPPLFACHICYENQPPRLRAVTSCTDCSLAICKTCLRQYLTLRIESGQVSEKHLCCPGCHAILPDHVLRTHLSVELYATLRKMLHDASERPACPYSHCGGTVLSTPHWLLKRRVTCSAGHSICVVCNRPYHLRPTCVDKAYAQWKKTHDVRSCPQCGRDIERNAGCNHMTCAKCRHEFCWRCLALWSGNDHVCATLRRL